MGPSPQSAHLATKPGRRIVLATFGSFGDLHPYIALALGLKDRGHDPVVATHETYRAKVEALGVGFRPVRPNIDPSTPDVELIRKVMDLRKGPEVVIGLFMAALRDSYDDTLAAAEGAGLLVAHPLTFTARMVAETTGVRWASTILAPMGFLSAHDPPIIPAAPWILRPLRRFGPVVYGPVFRLARRVARRWGAAYHPSGPRRARAPSGRPTPLRRAARPRPRTRPVLPPLRGAPARLAPADGRHRLPVLRPRRLARPLARPGPLPRRRPAADRLHPGHVGRPHRRPFLRAERRGRAATRPPGRPARRQGDGQPPGAAPRRGRGVRLRPLLRTLPPGRRDRPSGGQRNDRTGPPLWPADAGRPLRPRPARQRRPLGAAGRRPRRPPRPLQRRPRGEGIRATPARTFSRHESVRGRGADSRRRRRRDGLRRPRGPDGRLATDQTGLIMSERATDPDRLRLSDQKDFAIEDLVALYRSVGWSSADKPRELQAAGQLARGRLGLARRASHRPRAPCPTATWWSITRTSWWTRDFIARGSARGSWLASRRDTPPSTRRFWSPTRSRSPSTNAAASGGRAIPSRCGSIPGRTTGDRPDHRAIAPATPPAFRPEVDDPDFIGWVADRPWGLQFGMDPQGVGDLLHPIRRQGPKPPHKAARVEHRTCSQRATESWISPPSPAGTRTWLGRSRWRMRVVNGTTRVCGLCGLARSV